jgi:MFS family permease
MFKTTKIETSYHLLQLESLLTVMMFTVPVFTVFLNSVGLSQAAVGVSQAVFMAVAMLFDVPSGWLADRFSRKLSNCFGDLLVASGLFYYATVHSMLGVICAEILIGAGMAFTNGADVGLLRSYARKLGKDYGKVTAKLGTLRPLFEITAFVGGGIIATHNIRATFIVSGCIFVIGAIISLFIVEVGERRKTEKHPIRDMLDIAKFSLHGHAGLKWRIIASAVGANVTHTVIWIFTPMLLAINFTLGSLGFVWGCTLLFVSCGSLLAHRYATRLSDVQKVAIPMLASIVAYTILGIHLSVVTIVFVLLFSLSRGWFMAVSSPMIQASAPDDIQATVVSVSSLLRRLLYIPLVLMVNVLAGISFSYALLGSAVVYAIISIFLLRGLAQYAK